MAAQLSQIFTPFPSPLSYRPQDKPDMEKQIRAFYNQCQLYGFEPGSLLGRVAVKYTMDLSQKNLCSVNCDDSKTFQVMKVNINAWNADNRQDWTFTFLENGNLRISSFTLLKDKHIPLATLPSAFLNGNECEIQSLPHPNGVIPGDKTWDHWKDSLAFQVGSTRTIIFPLFHKTIAHLCNHVFHNRAYSVLDVGGCDGDLAFNLLDRCEHIESYTLIDKSASLTDLAAVRSQCDCAFLTPNRKKLKAVQADVTATELLDATDKKPVDIIILSGIVAEHVLTEEQSLKVMDNCKRALKDRGFAIVAAYSNHHFGASDYEQMGFIVHNRSYSFPVDAERGMYSSIPFYVLQKGDS
jgi:SAM-dependent methyltransferase